MAQDKVSATGGGIVDSIKNGITSECLLDTIKGSKEIVLWGILYGVIGFIGGVFFKHFSRHIAMLMFFFVLLFGLHYMGILTVTIDHLKINNCLGIKTDMTDGQLVMACFEWIKANIILSIIFVVGFLFGIRVG